MKVQICTGTKCTFYGANDIVEKLETLMEELHTIPGVPEDAMLELELTPCMDYCRNGNDSVAPVVRVGDELITKASSNVVMDSVLTQLNRESS